MSLANLGDVVFYWSPIVRRLTVRSVHSRRHFVLPSDAVEVGPYRAPFSTAEVLQDLRDLVERLPEPTL